MNWKDYAKPLIALPYTFWILYWIENGLHWITIILGVVLLFIVLPIIVYEKTK